MQLAGVLRFDSDYIRNKAKLIFTTSQFNFVDGYIASSTSSYTYYFANVAAYYTSYLEQEKSTDEMYTQLATYISRKIEDFKPDFLLVYSLYDSFLNVFDPSYSHVEGVAASFFNDSFGDISEYIDIVDNELPPEEESYRNTINQHEIDAIIHGLDILVKECLSELASYTTRVLADTPVCYIYLNVNESVCDILIIG